MVLTVNVTDTVMGTMLTYKTSQPDSNIRNPASIFKFGVPYFSISVSLNILLTLIIVIRLILHTRNIQSAIGATAGGSRSYKAIVTMLVESCALYAVSSVLYIGPWSVRSFVSDIFFPILVETQVRAFFFFFCQCRIFVSDRGDELGDRSVPDHSTSRQPEGIDEQRHCLWERRIDSFRESREVDGWYRDPC